MPGLVVNYYARLIVCFDLTYNKQLSSTKRLTAGKIEKKKEKKKKIPYMSLPLKFIGKKQLVYKKFQLHLKNYEFVNM